MSAYGDKDLIIGAEQVLVSDPFERYWDLVRIGGGRDLEESFQAAVREPYLCGSNPEDDLWKWISLQVGAEPSLWREALLERLYPLLAVGMITRLAESCRVHVVAESRAEWILPLLESEGVLPWLSSTLISSETGYLKPELFALADVSDTQTTLVLDADPGHLEAAARVGYQSLEADRAMHWAERLVEWVRPPRSHGLFVPRARRRAAVA